MAVCLLGGQRENIYAASEWVSLLERAAVG